MTEKNKNSAGRMYLVLAAVLLGVTALAKLISAAGEARILAVRDPLLLLTNRELLMGVGLLELGVATYLLFGRNMQTKCLLVLWLSVNFIVYRLGIWIIAPGKPCPCLGTLAAKLPLKAATVDLLLKLIVGYLFLGSVYFVLSELLRTTSRLPARAGEHARL